MMIRDLAPQRTCALLLNPRRAAHATSRRALGPPCVACSLPDRHPAGSPSFPTQFPPCRARRTLPRSPGNSPPALARARRTLPAPASVRHLPTGLSVAVRCGRMPLRLPTPPRLAGGMRILLATPQSGAQRAAPIPATRRRMPSLRTRHIEDRSPCVILRIAAARDESSAALTGARPSSATPSHRRWRTRASAAFSSGMRHSLICWRMRASAPASGVAP